MSLGTRSATVGVFGSLVVTMLLPLPQVIAAPNPYCFGEPATIVGTDGDDRIEGTDGPDVIVALGGKDVVDAKGGDDRVCLGPGGTEENVQWAWGRGGDDRISGGSGYDLLIGGPGGDTLLGGPREDQLKGGKGSDVLKGGAGPDTLLGKGGGDELWGGAGADQLYGAAGRDLLIGGRRGDYLNGGKEEDVLRGGAGADYLEGDEGDDRILGGSGGKDSDTVWFANKNGGHANSNRPVMVDLGRGSATGFGHDSLRGIENIFGGGGADTLIGDGGPNIIVGAHGGDDIIGRGGPDCLLLGLGRGKIDGGAGFDFVTADITYPIYDMCIPHTNPGYFSPWDPLVGVTIDLSQSYATFDNAESDEVTMLVGIEGAFGSWDQDTLIGDDSANRLFGLGDWDHLEGRGGDDYLDAGPGAAQSIDGGDGHDTCRNAQAYMSCEDVD